MTKLNEVKTAIIQVTYFLNGLMPNLLFCCLIILIQRKWFPMRNFFKILRLKFKFSGKFKLFNAINGSTKMLKDS